MKKLIAWSIISIFLIVYVWLGFYFFNNNEGLMFGIMYAAPLTISVFYGVIAALTWSFDVLYKKGNKYD